MTAKSQVAKHQQRLVRKALKKIAKNDPSTTNVVLNGYPFQEENIASLTMSLVNNTHVRILYLHDCGITARGAHLLAYALRKNRNIEHLWLNGNNIGSAGAEAIANALRENRTLQTLGLGDNDIGNHGGKRILESLKHNQVITDIFLEGNRMSDRIIDEIHTRCDRSTPSTSSKNKHVESCQFSCSASIDPLEDLDASTVMSSITSSYTRKMLECIEEEEEEEEEDEDDSSSDDDSSTIFDQDISCYIAQLTERSSKTKSDRLSKLKSFGRLFHISRLIKAEA
jgi:Ran GTPase-activating protein (RanGAP) involved in mRNA processing and transport